MKTVTFLLLLVVVAANWLLHLHIARSNASVPARLRVLKAYQFKWGLILLGCLMVVSLFLMLFMEPNVHWVVKLLLSVFVLRMLYMNIVCVKVSNNIILDGNAITIVKDGDISELNAAIHEKQIDVNNPSRRGGFPLLTAVARNEFEKAKLLLSNGANVNAVHREDGITALSSAVLLGNMNMISLLFERGADPNIRGNNNASLPLTLAAALGFDEVVKTLLEHGVQIDAKGSSQSVTALAVAASAGRVNIVRQLLEAGAEPNVVDANGFSPLHHAVQVSSPSDAVGHPGFQQAEQRDSISIVRDHQTVVELLLSNGADPNRQTPDGATPLHLAVSSGHKAISETLFQAGSNPMLVFNAGMKGGISAISLAWQSGDHDLARKLSTLALRRDSDKPRIFMSYRTSDVQFVRFLSEQLISRHIPVWFDEYEILTAAKERIATKPDEFERIISSAAQTASKAICITNSNYANSFYCQREAITLGSSLPPDQILNVTCPDHSKLYDIIPSLSGTPSVHLGKTPDNMKDMDMGELWQALSLHTGCDIPSISIDDLPSKPKSFNWQQGVNYTLDLSGWKECATLRTSTPENIGMDVSGGSFERQAECLSLRLTIVSGLYAGEHRNRFRTADTRPLYLVAVGKLFEKYLQSSSLKGIDSCKLVGLHLVRTRDEDVHGALTHYDIALSTWFRHYVIIVSNPIIEQIKDKIDARWLKSDPNAGSELEVSLQFSVSNCTFQEFCSIAYLMDRVAESFRMLND